MDHFKQVQQLKKENTILREHLQDSAMVLDKYSSQFGLVDQEALAKIKAAAYGTGYRATDWDVQDRNGEQ